MTVFLENNVSTVDELVRDFEWRDSPATPAQIAEVAAALHMSVPTDLADLLTSRGSGTGFIGEGGFLSVYPLEDWASHHEILNAATRWPGLLIFGNDGGNGLFGFDQQSQQYVEVDAIGEEDRLRPSGSRPSLRRDHREFCLGSSDDSGCSRLPDSVKRLVWDQESAS